MGAMAGAGLVVGAIGAGLKGRAGDIVRKRLGSIADTPGIDIGEITKEALTNEQKFLPQAQALTRSEAIDRQKLLNELFEMSSPGMAARTEKAGQITDQLLAGDIPDDIKALLRRQAAAQTLGSFGGAGGLGVGRVGGNRLLFSTALTGMEQQQRGLSWLSTLKSLARPMAAPQNAFDLLGPNARELSGIRGRERELRMAYLGQAAGVPGMTGAFGDFLTEAGGAMMGAGLGGMGGMGGGGGGGAPSGNPTRGYLGTSGGAEYFNVPTYRS